MCHNASKQARKSKKVVAGSSLVLAIFIIVVMSLLGATLMRMMSSSAETFAYEVLGTRAYAAAQTGLQWQLRNIFGLDTGSGPDTRHCDGSVVSPANTTFVSPQTITAPAGLSAVDGLLNCRVSLLTCADFKHDDVTYFKVTSTGQCDINGEKTSRTIEVEARSL